MKRLEREEYERMIDDNYHLDLIDEVLETFCDYPKKGKEQRLQDAGYKQNYLNLYRESIKEDFFYTKNRIMFYEEQLNNLKTLKTDMIDAEEADYTDDSLATAITSFVFICLVNWFIFGPLFMVGNLIPHIMVFLHGYNSSENYMVHFSGLSLC